MNAGAGGCDSWTRLALVPSFGVVCVGRLPVGRHALRRLEYERVQHESPHDCRHCQGRLMVPHTLCQDRRTCMSDSAPKQKNANGDDRWL